MILSVNRWGFTDKLFKINNLSVERPFSRTKSDNNKQEYFKKNAEWLEAKSKEDGVNALEKGVLYKVLQSGPESGRQPGMMNIVICHYLGRTIDGKCFDTSLGGCPLAIRMRELIEGWVIALKQMRIGDKWEIYIPSELGYGKISQPGIPAGSTLIFEVELIGIQ